MQYKAAAAMYIEGGLVRWILQVHPGEIEQQVCGKFGKFQELMSPAAGSGEVGAEKFCHRTENWK